jgi:hypothetical protein
MTQTLQCTTGALQDIAIMGFRPSYKGQTREEHRVTTDIGWLAAVSVVIVMLIVI